jgi:hypothetical protein
VSGKGRGVGEKRQRTQPFSAPSSATAATAAARRSHGDGGQRWPGAVSSCDSDRHVTPESPWGDDVGDLPDIPEPRLAQENIHQIFYLKYLWQNGTRTNAASRLLF